MDSREHAQGMSENDEVIIKAEIEALKQQLRSAMEVLEGKLRLLSTENEVMRETINRYHERIEAYNKRVDTARALYKQHDSELRAVNQITSLWETRLKKVEEALERSASDGNQSVKGTEGTNTSGNGGGR